MNSTSVNANAAQPSVGVHPTDHEETSSLAPPDLCRKLRTKMMFMSLVNDAGAAIAQHGESSTDVYWCLSTMECAGPDGGLAHKDLCGKDRDCYHCRD